MSPEKPFPLVRGAAFCALTVVMLIGPVTQQLFGKEEFQWLRSWQMFHDVGVNVCDVEYRQIRSDGTSIALDRYALLGHQRRKAPVDVRNLPDGFTIGRVGKELCTALPTPDPTVRARVRCASLHGWFQWNDDETNLCHVADVSALWPARRSP